MIVTRGIYNIYQRLRYTIAVLCDRSMIRWSIFYIRSVYLSIVFDVKRGRLSSELYLLDRRIASVLICGLTIKLAAFSVKYATWERARIFIVYHIVYNACFILPLKDKRIYGISNKLFLSTFYRIWIFYSKCIYIIGSVYSYLVLLTLWDKIINWKKG